MRTNLHLVLVLVLVFEFKSLTSLSLYSPITHYDSSYYLGTYRQIDAAFIVGQHEQKLIVRAVD